jgi:hypothetical protein
MVRMMLYDLADLLERTLAGPHFLLVFVIWTPIELFLTVTVHEAGHAIAALARRQTGVEIRMGTGQRLVLEARLQGVKLRLANPGFLRLGSGQVRWNAERTTVMDLLVIAAAGPIASLLGGLGCVWLARLCGPGGGLHDFLDLTAFSMIAFGGMLNLVPLTLTEGTRRRPGKAMRTDGKLILDVVRLSASMRRDTRA